MKQTATIIDEYMTKMAAAVEATVNIGPDQDILDGFLPLNLKLKAKLLKQNIEGLSLTNKQVGHVRCKFMRAGKFTIVELARNGKHYHGLSSRANCDSSNWFTGVAVAFNRAFDNMAEDMMENIIKNRIKNAKKSICESMYFTQIPPAIKHEELTEMMWGNIKQNDHVKGGKIFVVKTPIICDNFFEAIRHHPPAVGPMPPYLR